MLTVKGESSVCGRSVNRLSDDAAEIDGHGSKAEQAAARPDRTLLLAIAAFHGDAGLGMLVSHAVPMRMHAMRMRITLGVTP